MPPPILSWGGSVIHAADPWYYPTSKPETPFGGGDGSQWNPYRIDNAQHLANLAYMVTDKGKEYSGKYFVLTSDITLNDDVINDAGTGLKKAESSYKLWTPIGEYNHIINDDFCATFDGQGHTISGLVCIDSGDRDYLGLFGTTEDATIKNLNIKDSYVCAKATKKMYAAYGILIGNTLNTTVINCHISNSVVNVTHTQNSSLNSTCLIGGVMGYCDNCGGHSLYEYETVMTNCSFSGKIYATSDTNGVESELLVGGLLGCHQNHGHSNLYLTNCSTEGDIFINCKQDLNYLSVGGISSNSPYYEFAEKGCVNRLNITVDSGDKTIHECHLSGFGDATNYVLKNSRIVSQCVNLGTIKVGTETNKAKINYLYLTGMGRYAFLSSCAFYGKFDIHCKGKFANISSLAYKLYMIDNTHSVVCSVGNIIDIDYETTKIDQVSYYSYYKIDEKYNYQKSLQNCFYRFECTQSNVKFPCNFSVDPETYNKTVSEMKSDAFINTLNQEDGSKIWGKLTGTNSDLDGLPMPISCGGKPLEYTGVGTQTDPYVINTENDLNKLKEAVNNGTTDFSGKYFKLGSDIRITGTLDESIGKDYYHPFKGHFNGDGHAIVGLRKSLFGYMYGKVKNLALVDCDIWVNGYATALARYVGNEDNKAEVSNCYVSGVIASTTPWNEQGYASTFGFHVSKGSSIHDCYFKGRFVLKKQTFNTCNVAGIAIYDVNDVNTSADSPQGIFNCYASFDVKQESYGSASYYCYGICNRPNDYSTGNYFVCSDYSLQNYNGGIQLNYESELNGKFDGKSGWLQGVYRPVLASAKKYAATTPETTPTTVYFDAIPEENHKKNYFYNISIGDQYADKTVWNLPNMAVYVESEQMDYITNGYLDQSAGFKYNRATGAKATAGQLRYDLTQSEKGYHLVCLPGMVEKSDLPEGTKVMIVGNVSPEEGTEQQVNVVMVEDIPAGVPCFVYVPTTTVTTGTTIPLVMRSGIVSEPQNNTYGSLNGTFRKDTTVPAGSCISAAYKEVDSKLPYFIRTTEATTAQPFTAWLTGANGDVKIVDYVLLDEENGAMTLTLADLNNKQTNLKMRRTLKTDNWNTICLPYSLSSDEISSLFGSGTKVEAFSDLDYNSETKTYTLKFTAATEMTAGTPYLIKPATADADNIFEMQNKTIACASATTLPEGTTKTVNTTTLTMQSEYNHRMISPDEATDGKTLYVISGDKIYFVNSDVEMKGFRCYFVAEESAAGSTEEGSGTVGTSMFSNARVLHSDGSSTDLRLIKADATGEGGAVYDLLGRKRDEQTKGIVIVNGKKMIIKQEKK